MNAEMTRAVPDLLDALARAPAIRGYQPDREQSPDALLAVDLDDALRRFAHDRAELVARLRELRPDEWARTAEHEEYSHYSIYILFRHAVLHDMLHGFRIEECLLQKAWPDDGGPGR